MLFFSTIIFLSAQIDISDARALSEGTEVTVTGIITNGSELGIIRYLQDATGAIAVYPGTGSVGDFPGDVMRGDQIEVTGPLKEFNGLLEIDPITSYNIISSGNTLPDALEGTPELINEDNESELLTITGVKFDEGGATFGIGNYGFTDGNENSEIYVRSNHPLIGATIPTATVNLTGVCSQFNSIYQLLLRDANDIEIADDFFFTQLPVQSNISTDNFDISWQTNALGIATVKYGTDINSMTEENIGMVDQDVTFNISSLEPAEFYYIQVAVDNGSKVIESTTRYFSTASNSTGEIEVYFTTPVNPNFSNGSSPTDIGGAAIEAALIDHINNAQVSIDAAFYNINRTTIVEALSNAHDRGVVVRYVADNETANLALSDPTPPFKIVRGNNDGLMHNKFMVFDADSENDSWLFMGSTNLTATNLASDHNNSLFIQDKALTKVYTIEFQEMWGSDGADPGIFNVKFGPNKTNNTPHNFLVNNVMVESYFSPSDNTTNAISGALRSADNDLQFAVLSFTNNELGNAVIDRYNAGISVRGIIDNINDQGGEYDFLVNNGVNVTPDNTTTQTHHKYGLVDASGGVDPIVVTGSHNWSGGAETRNDENTLIFHSPLLANLYLQEFEARFCESMGLDNCTTGVNDLSDLDVRLKTFPNPCVDFINVEFELESQNDVIISLVDINGRTISNNILFQQSGIVQKSIKTDYLNSGTYFVRIQLDNNRVQSKQIKVIK